MNKRLRFHRGALVLAVTTAAGLVAPVVAFAHAEVSPQVSLSKKLQLYSLAVPTEKSGLRTTKIVMTVPNGFGIDSFAPPPTGWTQQTQQSGSGDNALITKVTWSGGKTPTGEDSLFQFLARPDSSKTYTFAIEQTYSDGSIVNWSGPETSDAPAPAIQAVDSVGGGGTSTISIIALIVGLLALGAGIFALAGRGGGSADGGRPLA